MTSSFPLHLPIDIPWKRVCVSKDMLDQVVCDESLPPRWNSSVAAFRYDPPDEYQNFPDYKISYLKISATITGYQPREKEVSGAIDWDGIGVEVVSDVESLLEAYLPCTGALIQVVVGPKDRAQTEPLDCPFFLDFEPKSRKLYEMATDTKERASRSQESLTVGKSAGNLESLQVLDIDQGGSQSFGVQASYAGTGGGFTSSSSTQGQWGTKSLGTRQSEVVRTQDQSEEKREAHAFTTQLSQLYHLFDAYHVGSNRALFFVQPRPHVLEQPSGFVRGPRPVDGIQEVFLVVARPRSQEDFCFSVRLDTSHLAEMDILDYAYKKDTVSVSASAPAPTNPNDPRRQPAPGAKINVTAYPGGPKIGERNYDCFSLTDTQSETYIPPWSDYKIDTADSGGYVTTRNDASNGWSTVTVNPDGESLTVTCSASGHHCVDAGGAICFDCPKSIQTWSGSAHRDIRVNLKSREPIIKTGTDLVVVITSRGVCCCPEPPVEQEVPPRIFERNVVLGVKDIGGLYYGSGTMSGVAADSSLAADQPGSAGGAAEEAGFQTTPAVARGADGGGTAVRDPVAASTGGAGTGRTESPGGTSAPQSGTDRAGMAGAERPAPPPPGAMTPQQANELGELIREDLLRTVSAAHTERTPDSLIYTDFFAQKLERRLRQRGAGRSLLGNAAAEVLPEKVVTAVAKQLKRDRKDVELRDVAVISNDELARIAKLEPEAAARLRLQSLGVKFKEEKPSTAKRRTRSSRSSTTKRRTASQRSTRRRKSAD